MPSPTNDTGTTVKIVDAELPTVTSSKYLRSLLTSEGGSQAAVNNRTRIGWMKWKEVSEVMCDRKMPVELKDSLQNNHQTSNDVRLRMLDRKEDRWEQTQFSRDEDVEMRNREDQVGPHQKWRHREGDARKTCWNFPGKQKTKVVWPLIEARKRNHICAKSLRLEVSGRRSRGRPKKRWRDNTIHGDMKKYQLIIEMAQYRKYWMTKILARPAQGDGQERWDKKVMKKTYP